MIKQFLQNTVLMLVSLVITYLAIEVLLFPMFVHHVPLKLHFAIKEDIRVLAQSSKGSAIPDKYLALFGDSYSQGYGDWLLDADPNSNPPYHSAHVLHDLTGRDVITFGKSGSGSLSGLVGNPIKWLDYIRRSRLPTLPDPEEILVYFYEGNDLNDNLADLKARYTGRHYDPGRLYDEAYFRDFINKEVIGTSPFEHPDWTDYFFFTDFLNKTIASLEKKKSTVISSEDLSPGPGKVNRARVAGKEIAIPDGQQSPALELSESEMHLTIYMFEQSLITMLDRFKSSRITVVYLPSVLACYELTSPYVNVQIYDKGREPVFPTYMVSQRSNQMAGMIRTLSEQNQVAFLDARPALQALGRKQILHGPKDWKHYNRDGYTTLARTISEFQKQHIPQ